MKQKADRLSLPGKGMDLEPPKSNLPLLLIATAFLLVTVVLVLLQPGIGGDARQAEQTLETTPPVFADADVVAPSEDVTRAQTPLLATPPADIAARPKVASREIAQQLRQPIRLTGATPPQLDLPGLTRAVLSQFTVPGRDFVVNDLLSDLLVESILQKQSDTYITVLLNTGAARGNFEVPPALRTPTGDMDVQPLLIALVDAAGGQAPEPAVQMAAGALYQITTRDSLAGLAMRHYGNPLTFTRLLEANPELAGGLVAGTSVVIP